LLELLRDGRVAEAVQRLLQQAHILGAVDHAPGAQPLLRLLAVLLLLHLECRFWWCGRECGLDERARARCAKTGSQTFLTCGPILARALSLLAQLRRGGVLGMRPDASRLSPPSLERAILLCKTRLEMAERCAPDRCAQSSTIVQGTIVQLRLLSAFCAREVCTRIACAAALENTLFNAAIFGDAASASARRRRRAAFAAVNAHTLLNYFARRSR
jgi:hypothetical protein